MSWDLSVFGSVRGGHRITGGIPVMGRLSCSGVIVGFVIGVVAPLREPAPDVGSDIGDALADNVHHTVEGGSEVPQGRDEGAVEESKFSL